MVTVISFFLLYVFEAFILWQYFEAFYLRKRKRYHIILTIALGYSALFAVSRLDTFWLNCIAFAVINFFLLVGNYHCDKRSALFHTAILTCIMLGTEFLTLTVLNFIFQDFGAYQTEPSVLILLIILSKLSYFLISKVCIIAFAGKEKELVQGKLDTLALCSFPFASVFVTVFFIDVGLHAGLNETGKFMLAACGIALVLATVAVFAVYRYNSELHARNLSLQLQLGIEEDRAHIYKQLQEKFVDERVLIHDMRHYISIFQQIAKESDKPEMIALAKQLGEAKYLKLPTQLCHNQVLNTVLMVYSGYCKDANILFEIDVRDESVDYMDFVDITALFSNLLSNAREAAETSRERRITLRVEKPQNKNITHIFLSNSCDRSPKAAPDGTYVTTKTDKHIHGLGLKSVQRVVARYDGDILQRYNREENIFTTVITLKSSARPAPQPEAGTRE